MQGSQQHTAGRGGGNWFRRRFLISKRGFLWGLPIVFVVSWLSRWYIHVNTLQDGDSFANGVVSNKTNISTIPNVTKTTNDTAHHQEQGPILRVFHVVNLYAIHKDDNKNNNKQESPLYHQPFDQWVTLQSIARARNHIPSDQLDVVLICAILPSDWDFVDDEGICDQKVRLQRSTQTEYGRQEQQPNNNNDNNNKKQTNNTVATLFSRKKNGNKNNNASSILSATISKLFSNRDLPFVQDLLDAGISVARQHNSNINSNSDATSHGRDDNENQNDGVHNDEFYLMLTNADIGLTKDFYPFLLEQLKQGRKAFQINRMSLPDFRVDTGTILHDLTTDFDCAWVSENIRQRCDIQHASRSVRYHWCPETCGIVGNNTQAQEKPPILPILTAPTTNRTATDALFAHIHDTLLPYYGSKHPGSDCFLMHSSILEKIFLGNQFTGYPPWAAYLKILLNVHLAKDTYRIINSTTHGTFHLGDDKDWLYDNDNDEKDDDDYQSAMELAHALWSEEMEDCPKLWPWKRIKNMYMALNIANCGVSAQEHYGDSLTPWKPKKKKKRKKKNRKDGAVVDTGGGTASPPTAPTTPTV